MSTCVSKWCSLADFGRVILSVFKYICFYIWLATCVFKSCKFPIGNVQEMIVLKFLDLSDSPDMTDSFFKHQIFQLCPPPPGLLLYLCVAVICVSFELFLGLIAFFDQAMHHSNTSSGIFFPKASFSLRYGYYHFLGPPCKTYPRVKSKSGKRPQGFFARLLSNVCRLYSQMVPTLLAVNSLSCSLMWNDCLCLCLFVIAQ